MNFLDVIMRDPSGGRRPTLMVVMLGRLLLLGLLLLSLSSSSADDDTLGEYGLCALIGIAFLSTIFYSFWMKGEETAVVSGPAQFVVDMLVITGLIHYTGGINSQLIILYPLVILAAGIVFSGRHAALIAMLGMVMYGTLVFLEMQGVLVYRGSGSSPYGETSSVIRHLMVYLLIFSFFAASASFITDRYFRQDAQLRRFQSVGQMIFDRVTAPLLALRSDGVIVLANSAASRMFGLGVGAGGVGMNAATFFAAPPASFSDIGKMDTVWEMRQLDGTPLRCMIEAQHAEMPDFGDGGFSLAPKNQELLFLVFTNLTEFLTAESCRVEKQRIHAAAGIVAEMAHEVCNPLTAIKSAGELLAETAEVVARQRKDMSGGDWEMINSMCNVISDETARLDQRVQYLMECAAKDPEKLLELSRNADKWMERLPLYGKHGEKKQDSDC